MGKLIVELPDQLHGDLKKKAAESHKTLKDIITGLINEFLYTAKNKGPSKVSTGLCGSWDDDRTADEIIEDVKVHRQWFRQKRN
jgi:hypothetical protein